MANTVVRDINTGKELAHIFKNRASLDFEGTYVINVKYALQKALSSQMERKFKTIECLVESGHTFILGNNRSGYIVLSPIHYPHFVKLDPFPLFFFWTKARVTVNTIKERILTMNPDFASYRGIPEADISRNAKRYRDSTENQNQSKRRKTTYTPMKDECRGAPETMASFECGEIHEPVVSFEDECRECEDECGEGGEGDEEGPSFLRYLLLPGYKPKKHPRTRAPLVPPVTGFFDDVGLKIGTSDSDN